MTDKRKRLARALSSKTGMSHQAAINALSTAQGDRDGQEPVAARPELRAELPLQPTAINWPELRALRAAATELLTHRVLHDAFAATRAATARREEQEALPGYDVFTHGQVAIPGADARWFSRLTVVVRALASAMKVEDALPPRHSDRWSSGWARDPEELHLVTLARHFVETADFLLATYDRTLSGDL